MDFVDDLLAPTVYFCICAIHFLLGRKLFRLAEAKDLSLLPESDGGSPSLLARWVLLQPSGVYYLAKKKWDKKTDFRYCYFENVKFWGLFLQGAGLLGFVGPIALVALSFMLR